MKTADYVKKYNLGNTSKFNHSDFIFDFSNDFVALLEVGNSTKSFKGYQNAVRAIRMKWDAISNKTVDGGLSDKLWSFFYATVIAKTKEKLFPKQMQAMRQESADRKRRREQYKDMLDEESRFWSGGFWSFIFASYIKTMAIPAQSFIVLGLPETASGEDVAKRYRELSLVCHPDRGGSGEKFIEITEAKNKVMAWLSKEGN